MNLDDWNKLKGVVMVSATLDQDTSCRVRIMNHIDSRIRDLSEVRPVLSPVRSNVIWLDSDCGEVFYDAWDASDC